MDKCSGHSGAELPIYTPDRDVLLLHLAEQLLDLALELALPFNAVHHQDRGRVLETLLLLKDQLCPRSPVLQYGRTSTEALQCKGN